ncbi:hypothetical protein BKA65DRAFT_226348 [Rhexocercosporidium sp. MPI-PUGE-AT-0058]|nr:hypothetical protein BKA65DRAFT_226348 [Rhexocercosporidium sp. MPI-PUGE-AT-0058]
MQGMENISLPQTSQIHCPLDSDHTNNENVPMVAGDSSSSNQAHGYLTLELEIGCQECRLQFSSKASLNLHTKKTHHSPYCCKCSDVFSRLDVLDRHIQGHNLNAAIPCPYCQHPKLFARQDHLTQHLRGFHSMDIVIDASKNQRVRPVRKLKKKRYCSHIDCWEVEDSYGPPSRSQPPRRSFKTQSNYTDHLREVQDKIMFPCTAPGCARKGGNGFFRNKALLKHARDHHSRPLS